MKQSKLQLILIITFTSILFFSCNHEDVFKPNVEVEEGSVMEVNVNPSDLAARLVFSRTIIDMKDVSKAPIQYQSSSKAPKKDSYEWELLAAMPVLEHNGHDLSVTQIDIHRDYAYITYNAQGSEHVGALEIVDISDAEEPEVVSITTFDDIDINSIAIDKIGASQPMTIWLAGSRNKDGAVVVELTSVNGVVQAGSKVVSLAHVFEEGISASANSICKVKKFLYITSGKSKGGITMLNIDDLSYAKHISFPSAKYVISNNENQQAGNTILVLSTGNNAKLRVYDLELSNNVDIYDLGIIKHNVENPAYTYFGKNTMSINNDKKLVYIAMGDRGVIAVDIKNGETEYQSPTGLLDEGNTNSVTMDKDFLYLANGADGLTIALLPEKKNPKIDPVFVWDMEDKPASVNYVLAHKVSKDYFIFVAKGLGGLKILVKSEKK